MSSEDQAKLTAKMQSWLGIINWLQMFTRPDLATIFSLLSTYMHNPSPGYLDAVKHVGKYILSTMDLGLQFSSKTNSTLESYIHFPLSDDDPTAPSSTPSLNTFFMLIGVHKMHPNLHLPILEMSPSKNLAPFVVTFSLWGVVLFYGKHTKKLE
jgi:hypothetical protein